MNVKRIAVISANLGGIDNDINTNTPKQKIEEGYELEFFLLTDTNFPPRHRSLHPRLQAKIPKMLGYELYPGFDYYIWHDGNFSLNNEYSVMEFVKRCEGYDICFLPHPSRTTVGEEFEFMFKRLNNNRYLLERYQNEYLQEQRQLYSKLEGFSDQPVFALGSFIYSKDMTTKQDFNIFQQWFYHNCRYSVQDQLSLPYLLLKNKSVYTFNMLEGTLSNNKYVTYHGGHK